MGNSAIMFISFNYDYMIKPEWHFILKTKDMTRKKLIQKLQQLLDKLPKGKERKAIRERLLKLKLKR